MYIKSGHSTITATTLVVNYIVNVLDAQINCAALFVDLSKAFNIVDHSILLNMAWALKTMWFQNSLSNRTKAIVTKFQIWITLSA